MCMHCFIRDLDLAQDYVQVLAQSLDLNLIEMVINLMFISEYTNLTIIKNITFKYVLFFIVKVK